MNEMYLKMILALPDEFFDGWEWQAGDKALSINDQYKRELLLLTTAPLKKLNSNDKVTLLFLHSMDGVTVEEYIFNLRPVPSQQQLQEMVKNHMLKDDETVLDYDIINFFCDWFKAHFCSKYTYKEIEHSSIKSVWLRYAMHIIYSKKWNSESWEKMA